MISGAVAVAVVAPAIAVSADPPAGPPAQLAACLEGQHLDPASGQCVGQLEPGVMGSIPGNPSVPAVDGIPCTGQNSGECIGLQQSEAGQADSAPTSTFGDGNETVAPTP
jgi:hypothetical protein